MNPDSKFRELPFIRRSSRYSSRKFPLHALTVLSGHSNETSTAYYNDGKNWEVSSYGAWQYTLAGRGRIDLKDGSYDLLPGSLMIVSVPGSQVYYLPEDSPSWEFVFLTMIGREAVRITRRIERHLGNVMDTANTPQTLEVLYEILDQLFSGAINDPFVNSCYTYRICMTLLKELDGGGSAPGEGPFRELIQFLKDNLSRDISVEEMAKEMNLSRSYFTRLFSREMGRSPHNYLEDLRLKTAMGLLYQEQKSVKETAALCGIYDVNYFCRLFKKRYGLSPGKYKKQ
ncbi:MAG: AraC family transcriptional regulator [Spirochaetaceae bacterium]|jgi:AraC-like DNA-binding protein|nr:AraC family transcriptional regulator [Spirochaetaceae bacterium]